MSNKEKYNKAFMESFSIEETILGESLEYNTIPEWDSIGHMGLIAELEDAFEISMEMDDIIDFSSYKKGMELLAKYEIAFEA
ncbi:MAG: acyl carrier protein [Myxococcota bacterium]|jgi:acyl carrier protein|nr:acyl carrier protein [Myxococcota bacterium]